MILGNEAQTIACTSAGKTSAASVITIPFTGYVGITQTACSCSVGTLPTGITVKSNTAGTASTAGKLELNVAASSDLGGTSVLAGDITLTFTVSGQTATKTFTWTKAKAGSNGTSAVVFSVYAPNGTVVQNQSGSLTLATSAYSGSTAVTGTYQWAKYVNGTWINISGATASTLTVSGADIVNIQSYRCTMTYSSKNYVDVITVEDKSDPYVSEMLSIGGFTVKNNLGGVVPYVIVRTNQREVDPLLGNISETAPSSPTSGMYSRQDTADDIHEKLKEYEDRLDTMARLKQELDLKIAACAAKRVQITGFLNELMKHDAPLAKFDPLVWQAVINYATVNRDCTITFTFRDGTEKTVPIKNGVRPYTKRNKPQEVDGNDG